MDKKQLLEEIKYLRKEKHFSYPQIKQRLGISRSFIRQLYGSDGRTYNNKIRYEKHCKQCGLSFTYIGYGKKLVCDRCKSTNLKKLKKEIHERLKREPGYKERQRAYSKKHYWTKIRTNPEKMAAFTKRITEYQKKKYQTSAKYRTYRSQIAKAYKERLKLKKEKMEVIHKMPS